MSKARFFLPVHHGRDHWSCALPWTVLPPAPEMWSLCSSLASVMDAGSSHLVASWRAAW